MIENSHLLDEDTLDAVRRVDGAGGVPGLTVSASHIPTLIYNKNGAGFRSFCSCGHRHRRASGCNRAGVAYAIVGFISDHNDHVTRAAKAKPAR